MLATNLSLLLLSLPDPFPRDGDMAEDHGDPEVGQFSRSWTRDRRETESPKSERRKESLGGKRRMRGEVSWDECP